MTEEGFDLDQSNRPLINPDSVSVIASVKREPHRFNQQQASGFGKVVLLWELKEKVLDFSLVYWWAV